MVVRLWGLCVCVVGRQVPASMKFDLNGEMPDYLLAKDIILQIIGDIGVAGATYRAMEFGGNAIGQVRRTAPSHLFGRSVKREISLEVSGGPMADTLREPLSVTD